jgi:hypothetical protein
MAYLWNFWLAKLFFVVVVVVVVLDRVSLYSPGCPGIHSVDQAGLELRNPPASASWVLGLKAFAKPPSWLAKFLTSSFISVEFFFFFFGNSMSTFYFVFCIFKEIYFIYTSTPQLFPKTPEEIPLQMVVSHYVVAGNWTQDLWESRQCS